MSLILNQAKNKNAGLIELLSRVDKRRQYYLYLVSCYLNLKAADQLIRALSERLNILETYIYTDLKTALQIGRDDLKAWTRKNPNIYIYAVDHSPLFHSKGYALAAYDKKDNIIEGRLILGSANLTEAGLLNKKGNIECLIDSGSDEALQNFIYSLDELKCLEIDQLEDFEDSRSINFRYAMLCEGEFLHDWSDDLNRLMSVKFDLNEEGKKRTRTDSIFSETGFNLEAMSVSKNYINFNTDAYYEDEFTNLKRNYGIECHLGYWIPRGVYEDCSSDNFDKFKKDLREYFESERQRITAEIRKDYQTLLSEGVIDPCPDPDKAFLKKADELLDSDSRMKRIYSKFDVFELPYSSVDTESINDLFDEITDSANLKKKKSISVKAWLAGIEKTSLAELRNMVWED